MLDVGVIGWKGVRSGRVRVRSADLPLHLPADNRAFTRRLRDDLHHRTCSLQAKRSTSEEATVELESPLDLDAV